MKVTCPSVLVMISSIVALAFSTGCGKEPGKDEIILSPVAQKPAPIPPSGSDASGSKNGTENNSPGATAPNPTGNTPAATAMTLDQAKAKCAACHQPGGSGAGVWNTANGTEADWKAFAPLAKASVVAGRMPIGIPLSTDEKTRLIAFLDGLLGITPPAGGPGAGTGGSQPPPAMTTFNFQTARALCVGCHSAAAPAGTRETPYLETQEQWAANKRDIEDEVRKGSMPRGKTLTAQERTALLDFIRSL